MCGRAGGPDLGEGPEELALGKGPGRSGRRMGQHWTRAGRRRALALGAAVDLGTATQPWSDPCVSEASRSWLCPALLSDSRPVCGVRGLYSVCPGIAHCAGGRRFPKVNLCI